MVGINDAGDKFVQSGCDLNEFAYGLFDILHEESGGCAWERGMSKHKKLKVSKVTIVNIYE